jgi:RNA polymerase sigma factor (sigma-70 family)
MQHKTPHADQRYIDAIRENDSKLIREIYKKFSGKVVSYIQKNNGDVDEGRDIIQETLITIYQQANDNKLQLTCPFDAYFFLLCKRKWLNKLKEKKGVTIGEEILSIHDDSVQSVLETEIFESKRNLFELKFAELGDKCQELLRLSFKLSSMEEVAAKLNVTYAYVRKKKSLCMGTLTELIQQSSAYKALKNQ